MQLLMDNCHGNSNIKIWLFWSSDVKCNVVEIDQQHITCEINHVYYSEKTILAYVYAKCKDHLGRPL